MKDVSFNKLFQLKKYKDLFDFKSIECTAAIISVFIIESLTIIWVHFENCNTIVNSLGSLIDSIGIALIGFLGFIVTGLALLTGAISSKIVNHLQSRNKMPSLERILLSFYLLGITSAIIIILSIFLHFTIVLPLNSCLFALIFIEFIYTYLTVFSIFYAVKLIGNCLELFIIINKMELAENNNIFEYQTKYNDYRLIALEKMLLDATTTISNASYKKIMYNLIITDKTSSTEKEIYTNMLIKEFDKNIARP